MDLSELLNEMKHYLPKLDYVPFQKNLIESIENQAKLKRVAHVRCMLGSKELSNLQF